MKVMAGLLRHRVRLEQPSVQQDATGDEIQAWSEVGTVWAEVLELRGREYITAREAHSSLTTKINIRHRSDVEVGWRAVHGSRTYDIHHIVNVEGRMRLLEMVCSEIR